MSQASAESSHVEHLPRLERQVFLFVLVGLPSFHLAIPLNWFLVERAALATPSAIIKWLKEKLKKRP